METGDRSIGWIIISRPERLSQKTETPKVKSGSFWDQLRRMSFSASGRTSRAFRTSGSLNLYIRSPSWSP